MTSFSMQAINGTIRTRNAQYWQWLTSAQGWFDNQLLPGLLNRLHAPTPSGQKHQAKTKRILLIT